MQFTKPYQTCKKDHLIEQDSIKDSGFNCRTQWRRKVVEVGGPPRSLEICEVVRIADACQRCNY